MIQHQGAPASFHQVALVGCLHGNSLHPKLFLPVWEEAVHNWGKAEYDSGFLSYDPSPLANRVLSLNSAVS